MLVVSSLHVLLSVKLLPLLTEVDVFYFYRVQCSLLELGDENTSRNQSGVFVIFLCLDISISGLVLVVEAGDKGMLVVNSGQYNIHYK